MSIVDWMGWVGAFLVLAAYALISIKKISSDSYYYHGINIVGASLLALYALAKDANASVVVNVVWLLIGIGAVIALYRAGRSC
jgi:hypothetical protein